MTKNPKKFLSEKLHVILLAVIIIIQCVFNIYVFAFKKTAYHEDEYFNFGLANSYKYPILYLKPDGGNNTNVWLTGDDFKYYVRVNDDTKFKYDSVWYNQEHDQNPPLQYSVTHTLCSIAQIDNFWIYGIAINLVCLIILQIFLYLLVIQLCRSKNAALLVCAFWGFTLAGQGNIQFIRMYAMLTMFCVMYAYYSIRLIKMESVKIKNCIPVAVIAFLGAMVQHIFMPLAFFITFLECVYFFLKKRFKPMFTYGMAALIGILLSFAAFSATIGDLDSSGVKYDTTPDPIQQLPLFTSLLFNSITGISYIHPYIAIYAKIVIFALVILMIPLVFLFRNEAWMKKIFAKIKALPQKLKGIKNLDPSIFIIAAAAFGLVFIAAKNVYYKAFGDEAVRYIYPSAPLMCAAILSLFAVIIAKFRAKWLKSILTVSVAALSVFLLADQNIKDDPQFILSAETDNGRIHDYAKDRSCITILDKAIFLPCYCTMLEDSKDVFVTSETNSDFLEPEQVEEYKKLFARNEEVVLLLDVTNLLDAEQLEALTNPDPDSSQTIFDFIAVSDLKDEDSIDYILSYFEELSGYTCEYCTSEYTHHEKISAYKFTPPTETADDAEVL